ncbi:hypothetical protein [Enterobacter sp. 22466]|uniref:hypothetical protein n=1 Tax=Enterobacter sp. 22466 TaxID=3453924 RepID=UPI003F82AB82
MRTISLDDLPDTVMEGPLFKAGERRRAQRHAEALAQTYQRCKNMIDETTQQVSALQKQGYAAGFHLVFQELVSFLENCIAMQHQLITRYQHYLTERLHTLFNEPAVAELIVTHLMDEIDGNEPPTLLLPVGLSLPPSLQHFRCLPSPDNSFGVQYRDQAIRFSAIPLCQQLTADAINCQEALAAGQTLDALPGDFLQEIITMLKEFRSTSTATHHENNLEEEEEHDRED